MAGSIREALEQAFDDVEREGGQEHDLTPIVDEQVVVPSLETPTPDPDDGGEEEVVVNPDKVDRVIAKTPVKTPSTLKPGQKAGPKPVAGQSQQLPQRDANGNLIQQQTDKPVAGKAPQSWKPAMREQFGKLPAEMQQEILRRESETGRALSESANSRKFYQEFAQVVRPFEALIAGSRVSPLEATRNLMTTAATLQTGTQQQKAGTIANMIKTFGVDIALLDSMLAGVAPKKGEGPSVDEIQRMVDARMQQHPATKFMTEHQRTQQAQLEQINTEALQTIEEFGADPKNEYFEDLREDMGDLMAMAAERGRKMTIQEAYERAAAVHPEISKLVAKKQAAERARSASGNVARARRAAASQPSGSPGGVGGSSAKPKGIRGALDQAWTDLSAG